MVEWLKFQLGKGTYEGQKLLRAKYFNDMYRPHIPMVPEDEPIQSTLNEVGLFWVNSYGLGWVLSEYQGRKIIYHGGGGVGYRSISYMLPEEGFGIVVLTNLGCDFSRLQFAPDALDLPP
jgi:CubicO group peptidase (beta-lactamase class C family)